MRTTIAFLLLASSALAVETQTHRDLAYRLVSVLQEAGIEARGWFGCYGDPKILLVTDADFNMLGRYEFDCSLGIVGLPNGDLLSAGGTCEKDKGCTGRAQLAVADDTTGLRFIHQQNKALHER